MTLVLSGKTKTPASRGSCQCRWGTACRAGMHAAPVCKVNHLSGKRSTCYSRTFRFDLGDRTTQPTVISESVDQARSAQWLNAPSMLFGHVDLAREFNRAGSRQYEHRREN